MRNQLEKIEDLRMIEALNKLPINREAKKKLIEVGEKPDPSILYVFSLMMWYLDNCIDTQEETYKERQARADLTDFLENLMYRQEPKAALDYLLLGPPGDPSREDGPQIVAEDLKKRTPEEAAWMLIDQLDSVMRTDDYLNYP
jgi:hypothetical protein